MIPGPEAAACSLLTRQTIMTFILNIKPAKRKLSVSIFKRTPFSAATLAFSGRTPAIAQGKQQARRTLLFHPYVANSIISRTHLDSAGLKKIKP